jgi:NAD(P)-dependent dehydrogenase (short-subunit alcohol dehydrogenase family)
MELKDKVAVITGGDSGIGFASARLFLEAGADVVLMSNNPETLGIARSQLGAKVVTIEADVTDTKALGAQLTASSVVSMFCSQVPALYLPRLWKAHPVSSSNAY